jgi:hypothetical protein
LILRNRRPRKFHLSEVIAIEQAPTD